MISLFQWDSQTDSFLAVKNTCSDSSAQHQSAPFQLSNLVPGQSAHLPPETTSVGRLQHKDTSGQHWPLLYTEVVRTAAPSTSSGRPVINFLPTQRAKQEEVQYEVREAERACGRDFQEDFTKLIWDVSQSLG